MSVETLATSVQEDETSSIEDVADEILHESDRQDRKSFDEILELLGEESQESYEETISRLEAYFGDHVFRYKSYSGTVSDLKVCPAFSMEVGKGFESAREWLLAHDGVGVEEKGDMLAEDEFIIKDEEKADQLAEVKAKDEPVDKKAEVSVSLKGAEVESKVIYQETNEERRADRSEIPKQEQSRPSQNSERHNSQPIESSNDTPAIRDIETEPSKVASFAAAGQILRQESELTSGRDASKDEAMTAHAADTVASSEYSPPQPSMVSRDNVETTQAVSSANDGSSLLESRSVESKIEVLSPDSEKDHTAQESQHVSNGVASEESVLEITSNHIEDAALADVSMASTGPVSEEICEEPAGSTPIEDDWIEVPTEESVEKNIHLEHDRQELTAEAEDIRVPTDAAQDEPTIEPELNEVVDLDAKEIKPDTDTLIRETVRAILSEVDNEVAGAPTVVDQVLSNEIDVDKEMLDEVVKALYEPAELEESVLDVFDDMAHELPHAREEGDEAASVQLLQQAAVVVYRIDRLAAATTAEECHEELSRLRVELASLLRLAGYGDPERVAEDLIRRHDVATLRKFMQALMRAVVAGKGAKVSTSRMGVESVLANIIAFGRRAVGLSVDLAS